MIDSLADFMLAGAHHTLEQLHERGELNSTTARQALVARYGAAISVVGFQNIAPLVANVVAAGNAASAMNRLGIAQLSRYGNDPNIPGQFRYHSIGFVTTTDPATGEVSETSVPYTVVSNEPLALQTLLKQFCDQLGQLTQTRDTIPGGASADLVRRDVGIANAVSRLPPDAVKCDLLVISAYMGREAPI